MHTQSLTSHSCTYCSAWMAFSNPAFTPAIFRSSMPEKRFSRTLANNPNHGHGIPISSSSQSWSNILQNQTLEEMYSERLKKIEEATTAFTKLSEEEEDNLSLKSLITIDSVQRLGIDYLFRDQIQQILENHYNNNIFSNQKLPDLFKISLRFRLLRQQGYYVPADTFDIFRNKDGTLFKHELRADVKGLMELYETSQLSIEEEDILDEAQVFSSHFLSASTLDVGDYEAGIVLNTLKNPYHKTLARTMVRNNLYNLRVNGNKTNDVYMELAKLDFNLVQWLHRDEIVQIAKWWRNNHGLAAEMKLSKEQLLEWFSWPLACLTNPTLSQERVELAKVVSIFHIIKDIFHFYGSNIDLLTNFVRAIHRWDFGYEQNLAEYMKMCLKILFDITEEIAYKANKKQGYNTKLSLQNAWIKLCNALLGQAKWAAVRQLPETEYYLKISSGTSAVNVVLIHTFFLLGETFQPNTTNIIDHDPPIISSVASIFGLSDDLRTTKDEDRKGVFGSYIESYMRQHPLHSIEEAKVKVTKMISNKWKELNKQCLYPNPYSPSFTKAALNCARLAPLIYGFDDYYKLPSFQQNMRSLLFQSIEI